MAKEVGGWAGGAALMGVFRSVGPTCSFSLGGTNKHITKHTEEGTVLRFLFGFLDGLELFPNVHLSFPGDDICTVYTHMGTHVQLHVHTHGHTCSVTCTHTWAYMFRMHTDMDMFSYISLCVHTHGHTCSVTYLSVYIDMFTWGRRLVIWKFVCAGKAKPPPNDIH